MVIYNVGQPLPISPLIRDTGPLGAPLINDPLGAPLETGSSGGPLNIGRPFPIGGAEELSNDSQSLFTQDLSDPTLLSAWTPLEEPVRINRSIFDPDNPILYSNRSGVRLYEDFQQGTINSAPTYINALV